MEQILSELKNLGAETEDTLERFMNDKEMYLNYVFGFPKEKTMRSKPLRMWRSNTGFFAR